MDVDLLKHMLLATMLITEHSSADTEDRGGQDLASRTRRGRQTRGRRSPPCLPAEEGFDIIRQQVI